MRKILEWAVGSVLVGGRRCRDWCMDYYQGYENGGFVVNPCNEEQTGFRVMRSGTCFEPSFTSRNSSRRGKRPYGRKGYFGFRLACIMR